MVGLLLRIILVVLIVRAIWHLFVGISRGLGEGSGERGHDSAVALVRDPICGTYVVPGRALAARDGALVRYFCSERCRKAFAREPREAR
jgi:YHS domain-containing protein